MKPMALAAHCPLVCWHTSISSHQPQLNVLNIVHFLHLLICLNSYDVLF